MRKPWLVLLMSGLLLLPAYRAADPPKNETIAEQKGDSKGMQPVSSGYVDVKGIKLYHEIDGAGEPLVLLHGGLMLIILVGFISANLAFAVDLRVQTTINFIEFPVGIQVGKLCSEGSVVQFARR